MATIVILIDTEEGHTLSTFWLSRHLRACGHRVCYLGPPDVECVVRNQGFEFISVLLNSHQYDARNDIRREKYGYGDTRINLYFGPLVRGELLDNAIAELRPSVALILSMYYLAGLAIRYRYRIPVVFFTPNFRRHARKMECEAIIADLLEVKSGITEFLELLAKAGAQFKNFRDVAELALQSPELALLPEAFDLPGRDKEPGVYYVGAGIDAARNELPFTWTGLDPSRPLVYCARGSQIQLRREDNRRLFQTTIDAAATRPEWQFIIAISKVFKAEDFSDVPPNVALFDWVPQFEVLSRSNVMVNHGGFGTVKECIHMGVPMVVLPIRGFRDHPDCAERVVYHGVGVQNDDPQVSPGELIQLIEQVINNPSFNQCIDRMREKLKQQDRLELAARVIESAIAGSGERVGAEIDITQKCNYPAL